jgi:hypothetical protein
MHAGIGVAAPVAARRRATVCFSGRTYPTLARIVRALDAGRWSVVEADDCSRCCQRCCQPRREQAVCIVPVSHRGQGPVVTVLVVNDMVPWCQDNSLKSSRTAG